jgi:hypothetical protein
LRRHPLPCFCCVAGPLTAADNSYWYFDRDDACTVWLPTGPAWEGQLARGQSAGAQGHEPWLPVRCVVPSMVPTEDS